MADIETTIRTFVINHVETQPVFGARYHLNRTPDNPTFPYVRATTVSDNPIYHQQGSGLGKARIQMDVIDDNKLRGNQATEALFQIFDGYRGTIGDYRVRIFIKNVPSNWEADQRYFRRVLEVEIAYAKTNS